MKMMIRLLAGLSTLLPLIAQAAVEVDTSRIGHGVKAWYVEDPSLPVVHVAISFEGAGSASDPAGKAGRAALAASLLTEAAGPYDALHFQQAMEDGAITITAQANQDRLIIHVHALREQAKRAGELLVLALTQPRFDASDMVRVKDQMTNLLSRLEESPEYQAQRRFEEVAFAGHPYASPPYGTTASIAALSAEDLHNYLATYVTRSSMLVAAAGDADSGLLKTMLGPLVNALGDGDMANGAIAPVTMKGGGELERVAMDVPQSAVYFAAPAVARDDPRFYAVAMLNTVLGDPTLTSRLMNEVRQEKGLVYGAATNLDVRRGVSLLIGQLASRHATTNEAIDATKKLLDDMRQRGVTTQECEDARSNLIGSYLLKLDGSRDIAEALLMMRVNDLGTDYFEDRVKKFSAVKCSDVNTVARELLAPPRFFFVTAGQP
jgi:zinc protease